MRTPDGWVTAPWTHLPMVCAPFADFTWRHARRLAAQAGRDDTDETEIARVLDELLTRAQNGPVDRGRRAGWPPAPGSAPPPTDHRAKTRPTPTPTPRRQPGDRPARWRPPGRDGDPARGLRRRRRSREVAMSPAPTTAAAARDDVRGR